MQVRDLASLVERDDVIATENLTTLFVVVPKSSKADWSGGYERLSDYVVRPWPDGPLPAHQETPRQTAGP